ncbi:hypothetical protein SOVF_024470 [Spinacia oleracea]|uniref:Uncharacterized protein LOC110802713 n=1 Tax=Spinacia oleracea TaxID=3562 RepID=A0A9R0K9R4_SPIOL|nr:embryogenesis-like protein [Spinacia oleracea]XP_021863861.1 embryogenesis-like protein [Spinacia oleracea]KNA23468.1 hypothetical protein SOVF_024470 [Spinacia oleracea]
MNQRSSLSIYTLLGRNPLISSKKPTSTFLFKLLAPISTHTCSPSVTSNPTSNSPYFNHPSTLISQFRTYRADSSEDFDKNKIVDEINLKFAEAREEIESAMDSKETVYFNEEAECARTAVKEVLDLYEGLLGKLKVEERGALQRSMGLKIEQLKAELQQLDD